MFILIPNSMFIPTPATLGKVCFKQKETTDANIPRQEQYGGDEDYWNSRGREVIGGEAREATSSF